MTATKTHHSTSDGNAVIAAFMKLHSIKIGTNRSGARGQRMPAKQVGHFFDTLALLLENGLSLRGALGTLTTEKSLKKHRDMLHAICRKVDAGETFSSALANYPRTFDRVTVKQLLIAEKSGMMVEALRRIAKQLAYRRELKTRVVKKLSYPALVILAGTGLICFMMLAVVPQFETMYAESNVELPAITKFVSGTSRWVFRYGWLAALALVSGIVAVVKLRKINYQMAVRTDRFLLRVPVLGSWLQDVAILQFVDTVHTMIESGFVPVDAISESVGAVSNLAVRSAVESVRAAVVRGDKLSEELMRNPDIFPPTVSQLVIVGEQTGCLGRAARGVRDHLRKRIENRVNAFVAMLEPILTISLAVAIGVVVLSIYMPMFSMFEVLE